MTRGPRWRISSGLLHLVLWQFPVVTKEEVAVAVEGIQGKIRELGIKPAFLRRLGPSVTKEELGSIYKKKIESLTRIFEEMPLFQF